ncbi:DUF2273 domain-containing protein [Microbacterium sp. VKM Ac-2870]|uniref:DUF2273 domain-containing protein n=1 Tax=Microbacterium sp. VKM Ac-2870 TaxID=2783825 RepID=UPI001889E5A2|nr:DUF2273 domain-containing protein [Microbacterium sp. VKM Ac-2870]MBF4561601.1 DUF2273 domain-containing protein [Microbacterium sp. VKM Ac-2870]
MTGAGATVWGAVAGAVLAFAALAFGFWGVVLVAVLAALGALVGAVVSGRIDLRAAVDAARGRRVG